jgi:hypothetical protein
MAHPRSAGRRRPGDWAAKKRQQQGSPMARATRPCLLRLLTSLLALLLVLRRRDVLIHKVPTPPLQIQQHGQHGSFLPVLPLLLVLRRLCSLLLPVVPRALLLPVPPPPPLDLATWWFDPASAPAGPTDPATWRYVEC